jgi:GNAT superfamily N-acetyltransferase
VPDFTILPLTPDRWDDFVEVMGPNGAMQGCWCMWFRLSNADFNNMAGDANREAIKGLVEDQCVPGLIAYDGDAPAGWVSLAPREEFGRVERSKFFQKVDDEQVWSIVCFYVPRKQRGKNLMRALLAGAIDYARDRGATTLEAYPRDPGIQKVSADGAFVGLEPIFRDAGFQEVARRDPKRPIMRLRLS